MCKTQILQNYTKLLVRYDSKTSDFCTVQNYQGWFMAIRLHKMMVDHQSSSDKYIAVGAPPQEFQLPCTSPKSIKVRFLQRTKTRTEMS